jgi:hypothetical protein
VCALFVVRGGKWTGYGLGLGVFVIFASSKRGLTHLKSDISQEIYVLPDDDMQCAIETCRSSESVLMCIILD